MPDLSQLTIGERLGEGGEGHVFLAVDPEGQRFGLKIVETAEGVDRPLLDERLRAFYGDPLEILVVPVQERRALANLPAALRRQLKGVGSEGVALLMPWLDGASLSAIVKERPLSPVEASTVLAGVAARLAKLPTGLAHGDVSLGNVFVRLNGDVLLLDPALLEAPTPESDLRALAALGRTLFGASVPAKGAVFLDELERSSPGPDAAEAADRFRESARALGAGDLGAVLAPRASAAARAVRLVSPTPASKSARRRISRWAIAAPALVAVGAGLGWARFHPRPRVVHGPDEMFDVATKVANGWNLYDTTGTVSYPGEAVHELAENEHLAHDDGLIEAKVQSKEPALTVYSALHNRLWGMRDLIPGELIQLDVKPGKYFVEIERDLEGSGRIQHDERERIVDVEHPYRFVITERMNAPPSEPPSAPTLWERIRGWFAK